MLNKNILVLLAAVAAASACSQEAETPVVAGDDPRHVRHELMEDVGDAAKVIGPMRKLEKEYDAAAAMTALQTMQDVSTKFGDLFPEGTETGADTEAAPAIWEDRDGFDAAIQDWQGAVGAAIEANAATIEDAEPLLGAVFKTCKGCHDNYRIEKD